MLRRNIEVIIEHPHATALPANGGFSVVISDNGVTVLARATQKLRDFLQDNRIFTNESGNECRFREGDLVKVNKAALFEPYVGIFAGHHLFEIGSFSYSFSQLGVDLTVGRYCSIAQSISSRVAQHPLDTISSSSVFYDKRTSFSRVFSEDTGVDHFLNAGRLIYKPVPVIGNDVWIGSHAFLNDGITIHDGSVVARGSLVSRDVAHHSIVGGNPAKFIKTRLPEELATELHQSRWWDFSPADLAQAPKADPAAFVRWLGDNKATMTPWAPKRVSPYNEVIALE